MNPPKKRRWKCRRSPRLGLAEGSLPALARVVAMTAGCRAVLLAATAFWLAGRRLFKARSNGIGVGVFRQDGTSDRPLPVSISGARSHGPSVGCRSGFLASPGFTRWALHRSNRDGVLLFGKLAQQAAPRACELHDWPGGPARGDGLFETFQSVCETSMLAWASGASKRAA